MMILFGNEKDGGRKSCKAVIMDITPIKLYPPLLFVNIADVMGGSYKLIGYGN